MSLLEKLRPALWPITNLLRMSLAGANVPAGDSRDADARFSGKPVADTLGDHVGVQAGCFPKLVVAAIALHFLSIPAAREWAWAWIAGIIVRDLIITCATAGLWDFVLYSPRSPWSAAMRTNKLNPVMPRPRQLSHDMLWALISTVISSAMEIAVVRAWATGALTYEATPTWWTHPATLLWLLTMPYWRLAHFFAIHRGMHPWRTTTFPDVGKVLYRYVHSLHHLSRNPTAWSGISMHPIESSLYYTAALIPLLFGASPIVFLYTKVDLTMAALIGHSGFGGDGAGSQTHWLHHNNFECNYGENYAPLDWLFGTFAANEADFQAKFGRLTIEPAGEGTEAGADAAGDPPRSGGATSGAGATVSGDLRRRPGSSKDVKAGMRT